MSSVLVVEDDARTANLLRLYLQQASYDVNIVHDGRAALDYLGTQQPDIIILDLMLPGLNGIEVCREVRLRTSIPVIILTARSTENDVLAGLDMGADDYITKPFSPREVVARVRTVLRRLKKAAEAEQQELQFGDLHINPKRHEVRIKDEPVHLTPKEFRLLETLAREPGRAFSRYELVERAFGFDYEGLERTVDAHIMNLRRKIEQDHTSPLYVETVYGIGYRFTDRYRG